MKDRVQRVLNAIADCSASRSAIQATIDDLAAIENRLDALERVRDAAQIYMSGLHSNSYAFEFRGAKLLEEALTACPVKEGDKDV